MVKLSKEITESLEPNDRIYLVQEIKKAEALLQEVNQMYEMRKHRKKVEERVRELYAIVNNILAAICIEMNYPLDQRVWDDSLPLEGLLQIFPGIEETQYWALNMAAVAGLL